MLRVPKTVYKFRVPHKENDHEIIIFIGDTS